MQSHEGLGRGPVPTRLVVAIHQHHACLHLRFDGAIGFVDRCVPVRAPTRGLPAGHQIPVFSVRTGHGPGVEH